jgi:UDP-N-acetylglucosamine--N-acetylmuramyl-(pentapeptide) pyrophosphoryl-undecaprenol N-acetylglucosamine transferase
MKKILLVGGGSGGHVMPILAILENLNRADTRILTDRKYFNETKRLLQERHLGKIKVKWVFSGKLRRYTHFGLLDYLAHFGIILANLRDVFLLFLGFWQSLGKLIFWRPDVIFAKGGYICVPVCLAGRLLGIPIILHESDAGGLGLANSILSKIAQKILTGSPIESYKVAPKIKSKMLWVGVPLSKRVLEMREKLLNNQKIELPIETNNLPIVLITGGSLGARRINESILRDIDQLGGKTFVILAAGLDNYDQLISKYGNEKASKDLLIVKFIDDLPKYIAASRIVVMRAGATALAEAEALIKPAILVPNGKLPNSHQVKNAKVLASFGAALVVEDKTDDAKLEIVPEILKLLGDHALQKSLSQKIGELAKVDASQRIAKILEEG